MSTSARHYHVEGVAPALCVRLGADVVPGLIGCSCVRQTVVLTVPEGSFTAEVERSGDDSLAINFTHRCAPCSTRAGSGATRPAVAEPDRAASTGAMLGWRVPVPGRATADRLAATIVAEIAAARDSQAGMTTGRPVGLTRRVAA